MDYGLWPKSVDSYSNFKQFDELTGWPKGNYSSILKDLLPFNNNEPDVEALSKSDKLHT